MISHDLTRIYVNYSRGVRCSVSVRIQKKAFGISRLTADFGVRPPIPTPPRRGNGMMLQVVDVVLRCFSILIGKYEDPNIQLRQYGSEQLDEEN